MERRTFLGALGAPLVVAGAAGAWPQAPPQAAVTAPAPRKGRLKQGVTRGVFARTNWSLDDMCREAAKLGVEGLDLLVPAERFRSVRSTRPNTRGCCRSCTRRSTTPPRTVSPTSSCSRASAAG